MANSQLIQCPACGKEVSRGAASCPHCGHLIKKRNKGCGCIIGILIFVVIIVATVIGSVGLNKGIQSSVSGVNDDSEYITLAEYNQIKSGMTYDEVCDIIGSNGTESATSSVAGYTTSVITWYGNGVAGSNANVTFQNGKVMSKAQVGLKWFFKSNRKVALLLCPKRRWFYDNATIYDAYRQFNSASHT